MSENDQNPVAGRTLPRFRIGGVTKMTGISVDTLRAWERRYQVVSPARAESAARLYSLEDIERLKLLKALVSEGHGIGSIAQLDRSALESLLDKHALETDSSREEEQEGLTVLAYSESYVPVSSETLDQAGLTLLGEYRNWSVFQEQALSGTADALVLELSALSPELVHEICALAVKNGKKRIVVIYGFSSSSLTQRLRREGISVLRAPVDQEEIVSHLRRSRGSGLVENEPLSSLTPTRSIDDQTLDFLSLVETSIECECPKHLADIIRTLNRFEDYCVSCENRNDADAALHVSLRATTALARASFERSLKKVIENEEIELPRK